MFDAYLTENTSWRPVTRPNKKSAYILVQTAESYFLLVQVPTIVQFVV